jgi:class 3 adenylate cyclase/predicted ATPase
VRIGISVGASMFVCKNCQTKSETTANYCAECGQALVGDFNFSTPSRVSHFSQPSKISGVSGIHTSEKSRVIHEKFVRAQESLEGSRKLVTVLFADINGFTALCEKFEAGVVHEMINNYFKRLGQIVYDFDGYIDKYIGDCIMALFGAPVAHENDSELAIRCALKMLEELRAINREMHQSLGMSIGVNTGLVIAGGLGSDVKLDFTVIGDAVNLAQRLSASAGRNQIFVGKTTHTLAKSFFDFDVLEPIVVKGKEAPVEVFSVTGPKSRRAVAAGIGNEVQAIVGRDTEIKMMKNLLHSLRRQSGILMVSGESGVGKSRLKFELRKMANAQKLIWYEARGIEFNSEKSYFVLEELLRSFLGVGVSQVRDVDLKILDQYSLDLNTRSCLEQLVGFKVESNSLEQLNPNQRKNAIFVAVRKWLLQVIKSVPTVLFVDDLQWCDPLSLELLEYLMEDLPERHLLIAGAVRSDFVHQWRRAKDFHRIELFPFSKENSIQFVKTLLGLSEIPEAFERLILSNSEGNPLFIREMVKALIDSGKILQGTSGWTISPTLDTVDSSLTIRSSIEARLDRLPQTDKEILQYASVIGRQFTDTLLAEASEMGEVLFDSLQFLTRKDLIYLVQKHDHGADYIFNHLMTQQIIYESILDKNKKAVHQLVAEAVERLVQSGKLGRLSNHYANLARHYRIAGIKDKAIFYFLKSARDAAGKFNNEVAIKAYEQVSEILNADRDHGSIFVETSFELAELHLLTGKVAEAEKYFHLVLDHTKEDRDYSDRAKAYRRLGDLERIRGNRDRSLHYLTLALTHSQKSQEPELELRTYKSLGNVLRIQSDFKKALEVLERGLTGARKLNQTDLMAEFLNDIGTNLISLGDLEAAEKALTEARDLSQLRKQRNLSLSATINLGVIQFMKSDIGGAFKSFKDASQNALAIGDLVNRMNCEHNLGVAALELEKPHDALLAFEESYQVARDLGNDSERIKNQIFVGYTRAILGAQDAGLEMLKRATAEAEKRGFGSLYVEALCLLSKYFYSKGNLKAAEESLSHATKKAEALKQTALTDKCRTLKEKMTAKS